MAWMILNTFFLFWANQSNFVIRVIFNNKKRKEILFDFGQGSPSGSTLGLGVLQYLRVTLHRYRKYKTCYIDPILFRGYLWLWENQRGSSIFVFHCIFMTQFFEVFWGIWGIWGAPSSPLSPTTVCIYDLFGASLDNLF